MTSRVRTRWKPEDGSGKPTLSQEKVDGTKAMHLHCTRLDQPHCRPQTSHTIFHCRQHNFEYVRGSQLVSVHPFCVCFCPPALWSRADSGGSVLMEKL